MVLLNKLFSFGVRHARFPITDFCKGEFENLPIKIYPKVHKGWLIRRYQKKNKRPIMLLEIRRFCIFQVDFLVIAVTRLKMNWSQLMNHSSILVNQAYFYGRFISTINDYVKNDLEFCSSLLVQSFNKRTLKFRVWNPKKWKSWTWTDRRNDDLWDFQHFGFKKPR